jgi:hypothetical protein
LMICMMPYKKLLILEMTTYMLFSWMENGGQEKEKFIGLLTPTVILGLAGLFEGKKFLYLFDFGDSWEFNIDVVSIKPEEEEEEPNEAKIIESVGESPSQYGDYDDDDE